LCLLHYQHFHNSTLFLFNQSITKSSILIKLQLFHQIHSLYLLKKFLKQSLNLLKLNKDQLTQALSLVQLSFHNHKIVCHHLNPTNKLSMKLLKQCSMNQKILNILSLLIIRNTNHMLIKTLILNRNTITNQNTSLMFGKQQTFKITMEEIL
jgi:hypothetical protein